MIRICNSLCGRQHFQNRTKNIMDLQEPKSVSSSDQLDILALCPARNLIHFLLDTGFDPSSLQKGHSMCRDGWRKRKLCVLFTLFAISVLLVLDLVDLFGDGPSHAASYGKVRSIISMIAYAGSQIVLLRTCITLIFVLVKGKDLITCISFVNKETIIFRLSEAKLKRCARVAWGFFLFSFLGAMSQVAAHLYKPSLYENFWQRDHYAFLLIPEGVLQYMLFVAIFASGTFITPPMIILFFYLASTLQVCVQEIEEQFTAILTKIEETEVESTFLSSKLRQMRMQYEALLDMTQQVQNAFAVKLLVDVTTNVFEILVFTAWLLIWFTVPEGTSLYDCAGKFGASLTALASLWMIGGKPLQQSTMPGKLALTVEDLLCVRHCQIDSQTMSSAASVEYIDKIVMDQSNVLPEERETCYDFLHRLKSSSLTFHAGDLLELDHGSVLTAAFFVFGFFCFVVNQIESFVPNTRSLVIDAANCTATWQ